MFIQIEPADFFMYRVNLIFDPENPTSEDKEVKDYLAENGLAPKHQGTGDYEGRRCEMMQFGSCYLGRHLERIAQIQRHAVEAEILTTEIKRHLSSPSEDPLPVPGERRQAAVAQLVKELHQESSFQTNQKGELLIALDQDAVVEAARRIMTGSPDS